jgi:hypothetical protein
MGYTTFFTGRFTLDRPLSPEHFDYLKAFSENEHPIYEVESLENLPDPIREAAGLPLGNDGEYFVGMGGKVKDWNDWHRSCDWMPSADGKGIEWNGAYKFYFWDEWLSYLIVHFLERWGYTLNGSVEFQGERLDDYGIIEVKDNWIDVIRKRRRAKLPPTHRHTWRR